jgi:hypothetical protein
MRQADKLKLRVGAIGGLAAAVVAFFAHFSDDVAKVGCRAGSVADDAIRVSAPQVDDVARGTLGRDLAEQVLGAGAQETLEILAAEDEPAKASFMGLDLAASPAILAWAGAASACSGPGHAECIPVAAPDRLQAAIARGGHSPWIIVGGLLSGDSLQGSLRIADIQSRCLGARQRCFVIAFSAPDADARRMCADRIVGLIQEAASEPGVTDRRLIQSFLDRAPDQVSCTLALHRLQITDQGPRRLVQRIAKPQGGP